MSRTQKLKNKPELSFYQKKQRFNAIILVAMFVAFVLAIGAAFYFYERHHIGF